ncbi:MAG TPA: hypothetical protein VH375_10570, partial [Rhodanobacteraceae bacterium]
MTMRQLSTAAPYAGSDPQPKRRSAGSGRRIERLRAGQVLALCLAVCSQSALADADDPRIPAHARVGNTALPDAKFEFACRTGQGGMLSISLVLPPPESVSGFPLDKFEGP